MGKAKEALPGLSSAGRSKSYHRRGLWAIKKKNGGKLPVHPKKAAKAAVDAKVREWNASAGRRGCSFCWPERRRSHRVSAFLSLPRGGKRRREASGGSAFLRREP